MDFRWEKLREWDRSENLDLNGRILLKRGLMKRLGGRGIHCSASGQGEIVACCEHHNEYQAPISARW
jgi:hypothetical protein